MEKETKNYLLLSEVAKLCPYDQEYLGLLARKNLIKAEKIGKKWFTTVEWVNEYIQKQRPSQIIEPEPETGMPKTFNWKRLSLGIAVAFLVLLVAYINIIFRINALESKNIPLEIANNNIEQKVAIPGYLNYLVPNEKLEF